MYTLLVTGAAAEQDHGVFRMDASRFLEYTDEAIVAQLKSISAEAAERLRTWPCILMEEGRADEKVRVGRITDASRSRRDISLTFEPLWLRTPLPLTNEDIWKLRGALDIGDFEFSRNHVSVKDRDVISVLEGAGYDIGDATRAHFKAKDVPAPDLTRHRRSGRRQSRRLLPRPRTLRVPRTASLSFMARTKLLAHPW